MKKKWSTGKIVGVALGSAGIAFILFISLIISIYQLAERLVSLEDTAYSDRGSYSEDEDFDTDEQDDEDYDRKNDDEYDDNQNADADSSEDWWDQDEGEYYDFHDEIRKDLSYKVTFMTDSYSCGENVTSEMTYPLISGENVTNLDGVNNAIQKELTVVREYMDRWSQVLSEEDICEFIGESYVTYMDEKTFSTVYMETGYINGEAQDNYLVSVNIDMETGMIISNTQILNMNDEFSIEFRKRSDEQNGEMEEISSFSDQDITDYLTDNDRLIIFYTPLGMEVGFNFSGGWVTVTYPDYENFRKQL